MEEQIYEGVAVADNKEFKSTPEDFMNLLEGENKPRHTQSQKTKSDSSSKPPGDPQAMKSILEKFHNVAGQSVSQLGKKKIKQLAQKKISIDREWKVVVNEASKEIFYDIVNTKANKSYFSKIKTLEAAEIIIEHLERKEPINSSKIFKVLDFDETFRRNRIDALQFKNKWKKYVGQQQLAKADIFEARYQKSKNLALDAKKQLKEMK